MSMFPPKPPQTSRPAPCGDDAAAESLIVAVKAQNENISKSGLAWALTHAARPGDYITLLAVFSGSRTGGRRILGFPRLKGDCRSGDASKLSDRISKVSDACSQMVLQIQNQIQVRLRIKVVSVISAGAVTAESKCSAAKWVILDKRLKTELKHCMDELHCNIVVMKGSRPKVLRLNLSTSNDLQVPLGSAAASSSLEHSEKLHSFNMKDTTPVSSPEDLSTSYTRTSGKDSMSSPDTGASIFVLYENNPLYEGSNKSKCQASAQTSHDKLREKAIHSSATLESKTHRIKKVFWIAQNHTVDEKGLASTSCNDIPKSAIVPGRTKSDYFVRHKNDIMVRELDFNEYDGGDYAFNSSIRGAISLSKPSCTPPPLCSLCQFKAPAFGKPPKQFQYEELEEATDGFSRTKFVGEGAYGLVHRGVLRNGLFIVVKQLVFVGLENEEDFCREVHLLSCAQHRNVVLLIGFCFKGKKRFLVYEYICNNSLDFHLHGNEMPTLDWQARLKIAIGTAKGLRYLHEDCRVGCIIHKNLRPSNILLTHDFEPLVADFGLARLHNEQKFFDRNQIIGTSWNLSQEYFNDYKVTEKVDVYAYGLVLLELITGCRAHDLQYSKEHQFMLDGIHALAAVEPTQAYNHEILGPLLSSQGLPDELHAMTCAASWCLQHDPDQRPSMSKVVKMLEGRSPIGCRSWLMQEPNANTIHGTPKRHSRRQLSY